MKQQKQKQWESQNHRNIRCRSSQSTNICSDVCRLIQSFICLWKQYATGQQSQCFVISRRVLRLLAVMGQARLIRGGGGEPGTRRSLTCSIGHRGHHRRGAPPPGAVSQAARSMRPLRLAD